MAANTNGGISVPGFLQVYGDADINSDLTIDGDATIGGDAVVTGGVAVTGDVSGASFKLTATGTTPAAPTEGTMFANSGNNTLQYYNGTAWKQVTFEA